MTLNLILVFSVVVTLKAVILLLIRGEKNRSQLKEQLIEFSNMSERLAKDQAQPY